MGTLLCDSQGGDRTGPLGAGARCLGLGWRCGSRRNQERGPWPSGSYPAPRHHDGGRQEKERPRVQSAGLCQPHGLGLLWGPHSVSWHDTPPPGRAQKGHEHHTSASPALGHLASPMGAHHMERREQPGPSGERCWEGEVTIAKAGALLQVRQPWNTGTLALTRGLTPGSYYYPGNRYPCSQVGSTALSLLPWAPDHSWCLASCVALGPTDPGPSRVEQAWARARGHQGCILPLSSRWRTATRPPAHSPQAWGAPHQPLCGYHSTTRACVTHIGASTVGGADPPESGPNLAHGTAPALW